ncbi:MAG: VanW family protein [Clostridia bacterium]|nr:VanW family protein [Clostridia bacterium]
MAEGQHRARRAERYSEQTPERVNAAAQQASAQPQANYGAAPQQTPYGGMPPGAISQQEAYYQAQQQQQYYQQQQAMQQEYARQQYAWQQEQQRLHRQRVEKERVSSETSSHGAFRGYTGQTPAIGGQGNAQPLPPPKKKGHVGLILVIVAMVALLGTGGGFALRNYLQTKEIHDAVSPYDNLFVEGVYVDGIHLGGMTPEQGLNSVQSQIQQRNDAWNVTLTYHGAQLAQINAGMLGMSVDIGQVLNDAWAQGHTGDEATRYAAMAALKETPYEAYTATPSGDTSVIDNVLAQVKSQIDTQAVNARLLSFDPSQAYPFTFQEESKGLRLNVDEVREELYHMVATMTSGNVELQPEVIEPNTYLVDLQKHYMLRSSVYTPISTSSEEDRNNNIRRAFEFINGYVLQPGTQFSFNNVVGERTEANGFFPAIEYAYGEHVMGIGGGVCQASTTVYQAAVCAGLQIVKREPHSDAVSYTEYGKDATVYWLYKRKIDLVFRNNTEDPIYMVAAVQQDPSNKRRLIAKVMMYGADMGDVRYEIECKTVQEIDPPETPTYIKDKDATYVTYTDQQKSVSKAKPGYVVESYRVKYQGNTEVERALLYSDTYEPKPERVYVGVTKRE